MHLPELKHAAAVKASYEGVSLEKGIPHRDMARGIKRKIELVFPAASLPPSDEERRFLREANTEIKRFFKKGWEYSKTGGRNETDIPPPLKPKQQVKLKKQARRIMREFVESFALHDRLARLYLQTDHARPEVIGQPQADEHSFTRRLFLEKENMNRLFEAWQNQITLEGKDVFKSFGYNRALCQSNVGNLIGKATKISDKIKYAHGDIAVNYQRLVHPNQHKVFASPLQKIQETDSYWKTLRTELQIKAKPFHVMDELHRNFRGR